MNAIFSTDAPLIFARILGAGLAMDAFSVSLANGLNEPAMKRRKMCGIAGVFAGFQLAMPLIGWVCVSTIAQYFKLFAKAVPWIALLLLCYIGGKMLYEGVCNKSVEDEKLAIGLVALLLQGVATSIDALSVGFTIVGYSLQQAVLACLLIGVVTFFICVSGLLIGRKVGTRFAGKAGILGGAILVLIGLKIFITALI